MTESFPVILVFETSCESTISTISDNSSTTSDITPRPIDQIEHEKSTSSVSMTPAPFVQRIPRPADEALSFSSIWDSDMIEQYHRETRHKKTGNMHHVARWRCHHCMEDWAGNNATKVLRHVVGIKKDHKPCTASIPSNYQQAYVSHLHSKMEAKSDRALRQEIIIALS